MSFFNKSKSRRVLLSVILAAFAVIALTGCEKISYQTLYEKGIVATASPIASEIGKKVIEDGGNAFDAAVAVGFVMAVTHPMAGNIGGGGFAVIRNGQSGMIETIDFRETAPQTATETMFLDLNGDVIDGLSTTGAKAAGVPGTVAGLYELWSDKGSMEWEALVNIAAALADTGFVVDAYLANSLAEYKSELSVFDQTYQTFFPEGSAPAAGERLYQKNLARALYLIAADGPKAFYEGAIADSLEATMVEQNGLITKPDLINYQIIKRDPIHFTFDSLDIYTMPPPSSGGIILNQILKSIEPYDFARYNPQTVEYIHLFTEFSKLSYADRSEYMGDPLFYDVPTAQLTSPQYIEDRATQVDLHSATPSSEVKPGLTGYHESDQTTHFSICDNQGNMVALTYTLNTNYGSKLMVNGFGILLNNEMDDFSIKPGVPNTYGLVGGEANKVEPEKRMLSSMTPTIILKDGKPFAVLGSPGGSKIITVVAEAIINLTRFNLNPEETAAQPRFHHQWLPDLLYYETGAFDPKTISELEAMGHKLQSREPYSDLQLIYIDGSGLMSGASDPRHRGVVRGL